MNEEQLHRKLAAIFFADVVGYSRLMRDDEGSTVSRLAAYREIFSNLVLQHRGRIVDMSGDNVLAEFSSVVDAMQSAVSIQKELKARNSDLPENQRMHFRIGINIGDVIEDENRIYGDGVNIAARLEALAEPGGICISRTAYDQIESKLPLGYKYLGEQNVKNINKPLHAYRVVIEPSNGNHISSNSMEDLRKEHGQTRHEARHESTEEPEQKADENRSETSFHGVGDRIKEFAKDLKEDEHLSETMQEIKGRVRNFSHDMKKDPESRKKFFHSLVQDKDVKIFLGFFAIFLIINLVTSFGSWWFPFPVLSIGLVIYLRRLKTSFFTPERIDRIRAKLLQKELSELDENSPDFEREKWKIEAKVKGRIQFYNHLYVYVGINAFLLLINLLTSPFNLWFHFPLIFWGLGLFMHWMKLR